MLQILGFRGQVCQIQDARRCIAILFFNMKLEACSRQAVTEFPIIGVRQHCLHILELKRPVTSLFYIT